MSDFETASIYIDLDSLFDTRMATLALMGVSAVESALADGYYNRFFDEFEGVDTEAFKERYAKRNSETLRQSMVTQNVELLRKFAKQTLVALVSSPLQRQPKAVVNTYPYELTESEIELIVLGLRAATKSMMDIEVIHVSLEKLTPSYVKANFVQMVMYSYWEWLDIHAGNGNLANTQCHNVQLIGPAIVKSREAARLLKGTSIFQVIESYTGLFIKLTLCPVSVYCMDLDRLKASRQAAQATTEA